MAKKIKINQSFWKDQFVKQAKEPLSWWLTAISLRRASEILLRTVRSDSIKLRNTKVGDQIQPSVSLIYLFLVALCVENLAKGILIGRDPSTIIKSGLVNFDGIGNHELKTLLVQDCKIKFSKDERDFLSRLEAILKWAGRYPIPKRFQEFLPRQFGNSWGQVKFFSSNDPAISKSILDKLQKAFDRLLKDLKAEKS